MLLVVFNAYVTVYETWIEEIEAYRVGKEVHSPMTGIKEYNPSSKQL
jgi:hypothetical protein